MEYLIFPITYKECVAIRISACVCPADILLWEKTHIYLDFKTKIYIDATVHNLVFLLLKWAGVFLGHVDTGLFIKHIDVFRQDNLTGETSGSGF